MLQDDSDWFVAFNIRSLSKFVDLESLLVEIASDVCSLSNDWIWNHEPLSLKVDKAGNCIKGHIHNGGDIQDEWFVAHLMKTLSSHQPDLIIEVYDEDGEFLLIEAADYIPDWIDPENAEHRVYFHKGQVIIVDIEKETSLSVADATSAVIGGKFLKDSHINKCIDRRIAKSLENPCHSSHFYVPCVLSAVLSQKPEILSLIIHCFMMRDELDMKALTSLKFSPDHEKHSTMINLKLRRNQFSKFSSIPYSSAKIPRPENVPIKAYSLGTKLAIGFELLMRKCEKLKKSDDSDGFCDTPLYAKFMKSLEKTGFFKGNLEKSRDHAILTKQAKEFFKGSFLPHNGDAKSLPYLYRVGIEVLQNFGEFSKFDNADMERRARHLPPPESEAWMMVNQESIDAMISERMGGDFLSFIRNPSGNNDASSTQTDDKLTSRLDAFLRKESDYKGIEMPGSQGSKHDDFDDYFCGGSESSDDNELDKDMADLMAQMDFELNSKIKQQELAGGDEEDENGDHTDIGTAQIPVKKPAQNKPSKKQISNLLLRASLSDPGDHAPSGAMLLMQAALHKADKKASKADLEDL